MSELAIWLTRGNRVQAGVEDLSVWRAIGHGSNRIRFNFSELMSNITRLTEIFRAHI